MHILENKIKLIKRKLASAYELPPESLGGVMCAELIGSFQVSVRGCQRIAEYGTDKIVLASDRESVVVEGDKLLISDFVAGELLVTGEICKISVLSEEKHDT